MKISKSVLLLSGAGIGLGLIYAEQGTNCTPTKAQLILRQKIAELKGGADALPSKDQLLNDVERLHTEGKISDEQYATFKKNVSEQYLAPDVASNAETQTKAEKLLEQKIVELNAGQTTTVPPATKSVQSKAEQALEKKMKESQASVPAN